MALELIHCEGIPGPPRPTIPTIAEGCKNPPKWRCTECLANFCGTCIEDAEHCPECQEAI